MANYVGPLWRYIFSRDCPHVTAPGVVLHDGKNSGLWCDHCAEPSYVLFVPEIDPAIAISAPATPPASLGHNDPRSWNDRQNAALSVRKRKSRKKRVKYLLSEAPTRPGLSFRPGHIGFNRGDTFRAFAASHIFEPPYFLRCKICNQRLDIPNRGALPTICHACQGMVDQRRFRLKQATETRNSVRHPTVGVWPLPSPKPEWRRCPCCLLWIDLDLLKKCIVNTANLGTGIIRSRKTRRLRGLDPFSVAQQQYLWGLHRPMSGGFSREEWRLSTEAWPKREPAHYADGTFCMERIERPQTLQYAQIWDWLPARLYDGFERFEYDGVTISDPAIRRCLIPDRKRRQKKIPDRLIEQIDKTDDALDEGLDRARDLRNAKKSFARGLGTSREQRDEWHSTDKSLRFGANRGVAVGEIGHRLAFYGLVPATLCRSHLWNTQSDVPCTIASGITVTCLKCQHVEAMRGTEISVFVSKRGKTPLHRVNSEGAPTLSLSQ